jgi:hypothetical protein
MSLLWPKLQHNKDSSLKHDQGHLCLKHALKLCLGLTQNIKNWPAKLFEFIIASVKISRSFDGFIHICNWVF